MEEINTNNTSSFDFSKMWFASVADKITLRDQNNNVSTPTFNKYTKSDIIDYLKDPYKNEKKIRDAVIYMYGASPIFMRIVQYFASLNDFSYILTLDNVDTANENIDKLREDRLKCAKLFASLGAGNQLRDILVTCFREDVFYATSYLEDDKIVLQKLPSDYCSITTIQDNVMNVTFDFSYFNGQKNALLDYYPKEFKTKYNAYSKDRRNKRYQELDVPNSFAIKANRDILDYALPPLIGVMTSLYDLADYQELQLTKTELDNYALLVMKLAFSNGGYELPEVQSKGFFKNLANVLPQQVGAVLSPMPIEKIDFGDDTADRTAEVENAENSIFTAAGVSSLLFNNPKASSNALLLSIKADQALTYGVVQSIADALNRILKSYNFGEKFKIKFLDSSRFNRDELANQYSKGFQYGIPTISMYCSVLGLAPEDIDGMNYMENDILGLIDKFRPLSSSNTQSSATEAVGRPEATIGDISDEGEEGQEKK